MTAQPLRLAWDADSGEVQSSECPKCQETNAMLAGARADYEAIVKELATVIRQRDALRLDKEEGQRRDNLYPLAHKLFEFWQVQCGHPNAEFGSDRVRLALAALKLYKTPEKREKLWWAILGAKHAAYRDPKGKVHDSFGLIFRGSEQIEDFANRYARWKAKNR